MKKNFLTLLLTAFVVALTSTTAMAGNETITIKTQIFCSHCLQCGSCGKNINDHISENAGIKKVSVDPKANTITVTYDADKISPEKIRKAINAAGYDADDQKAPATAVNSLDGCCKKH